MTLKIPLGIMDSLQADPEAYERADKVIALWEQSKPMLDEKYNIMEAGAAGQFIVYRDIWQYMVCDKAVEMGMTIAEVIGCPH